MDIDYELQALRYILETKDLDYDTITDLIANARIDILDAVEARVQDALDIAIDAGIEQRSADFINEVVFDPRTLFLVTRSGGMNFSLPRKPMLPFLLKNAKPMKDGSGVYKVIPVGSNKNDGSRDRQFLGSIEDVQRAMMAEKKLAMKAKQEKAKPREPEFRTATSKQDANTQWVLPAKEKDFTEVLTQINEDLQAGIRDDITRIIRQYEEI